MQLQLTEINRREVLQYLQWRGSEIPPEVDAQISAALEETLQTAEPIFVWRMFSLDKGKCLRLKETGTELPGEDLRLLLEDCTRCVLMAVTLGCGFDRAMAKARGRDMTRAVLLDSCGSAAVEAACELAENEIRTASGADYLTDRFSPGYGDLPLDFQTVLTDLLDTRRRIGLTLTDSLLMTPTKSVTAILGIADRPQIRRFRGCAYCGRFDHCEFRKGNNYCGRT